MTGTSADVSDGGGDENGMVGGTGAGGIGRTETVTVSFEGEGSGSAELNWGQQHIWGAIQSLGSTMNMGAVRELAPTARVEDFTVELRFYLSRFQAMRTLLRLRPGGLPVQVVVASGEAPLGIVDMAPGDDAAAVAAALLAEQEDRPFDYESEFPIRMTLVRHRGVLTHLVTVLSHFATDGAGAFAMYDDFVHRDPVTGLASAPVRMQPLDLTAQQSTPAGRRQSDASLRYWEQQLAALAPRRPRAAGTSDASDGRRYWQLETRSVPMMLGATKIAHRLECDVSAVLLGLFAIALARVTGDQPSAAQMLVSNRFRPGLADIVGNVSQTGLFVVDVADTTVDEVVERARRAATRTYKHAYFDLAQWRELLAKAASARGEDGEDIALCYYNDRPSQRRSTAPGTEPSIDRIAAAASVATPAKWTELPFFNERLMVTVDNVAEDTQDAVTLLVLADTWYVPRTEMEEIARLMESLAVAAACDALTGTGVVGRAGRPSP
jgi:hypothetical protein